MHTIHIALVGALALAPVRIAFAEEPAPTVPADDGLAAAQAYHVEADAKYNTADYAGAIDAWQRAYAALPRTAEANTYRTLILYNIAAAREKLFSLHGDVGELKAAKILLEQFRDSIPETYAGAPAEGEAERAQVEAKIARIDELIADAARDDVPAKPKVVTPPAGDRKPPATDVPPPAPRDRGRGLMIGGGVLLGVGVLAGAGMGAALAVGARANDIDDLDDSDFDAREERFDRGRRANAGAIASGVIGLACVAAGVALVVVGSKRRGSSSTAMAPFVGRGLAGVALGGRF